MANLKEDTLCAVKMSGHTLDDIKWIGNEEFYIDTDEFWRIADYTDYDEGYGWPEIATDLCVYFDDGSRLYRGEYDGSEWWEYMQPVVDMPTARLENPRLKTTKCGWNTTLRAINFPTDDEE